VRKVKKLSYVGPVVESCRVLLEVGVAATSVRMKPSKDLGYYEDEDEEMTKDIVIIF
jgi:hypothetical protein